MRDGSVKRMLTHNLTVRTLSEYPNLAISGTIQHPVWLLDLCRRNTNGLRRIAQQLLQTQKAHVFKGTALAKAVRLAIPARSAKEISKGKGLCFKFKD